MSPLRGRVRKAPIVDISDSSSQASEDNVPPTEPPKTNRVALHYAAESPDKPDAKMNGQYGMLSQCSPLSPPPPMKPLAKCKRASGGNKKKTAAKMLVKNKISEMNEVSRKDREDSPLFEPEEGWGVQMQDFTDTDTVMLSPPSTPASKDHLPNRKKG